MKKIKGTARSGATRVARKKGYMGLNDLLQAQGQRLVAAMVKRAQRGDLGSADLLHRLALSEHKLPLRVKARAVIVFDVLDADNTAVLRGIEGEREAYRLCQEIEEASK